MVDKPLYHALHGKRVCNFLERCHFHFILVFYILGAFLIKLLFHSVGYEMIRTNSVPRAIIISFDIQRARGIIVNETARSLDVIQSNSLSRIIAKTKQTCLSLILNKGFNCQLRSLVSTYQRNTILQLNIFQCSIVWFATVETTVL